METIVTGTSAVLSLWAELGILGMFMLLILVILVGIYSLASKLTKGDFERDKANSQLSSRQLEMMAAQHTDYSKLNLIVSDTLRDNTVQFRSLAEQSVKLNAILELIQAGQETSRTTTLASQLEGRLEFNQILEKMTTQEGLILNMSNSIEKISKNLTVTGDESYRIALKSLVASANKALEDMQSRISELVTQQKEKEARNIYVEKEMPDLLGNG